MNDAHSVMIEITTNDMEEKLERIKNLLTEIKSLRDDIFGEQGAN